MRLSKQMGTSRNQSRWLWDMGCRRLLFSARPHRNAFETIAASSTQGLFQRHLKTRAQQLCWAFGGNDHVVFAAHAEFAGDVDAGLVGKSHAGFEHCGAASHQIGMLVAVQTDAVT